MAHGRVEVGRGVSTEPLRQDVVLGPFGTVRRRVAPMVADIVYHVLLTHQIAGHDKIPRAVMVGNIAGNFMVSKQSLATHSGVLAVVLGSWRRGLAEPVDRTATFRRLQMTLPHRQLQQAFLSLC
mmetsp:Transcript_24197/g.55056  ORF Transcript_24197/g.55056 Transcript_24197/m.55056 type:complete len:125 (-) Transcript_24197:1068-1442(-)